jgi:hypothetical protein
MQKSQDEAEEGQELQIRKGVCASHARLSPNSPSPSTMMIRSRSLRLLLPADS